MRKVESVYMTKDKDSIFCGRRGVDAGQNVNVNTINKLQRTPWEINEDILHLINDTLKPSDESLTAIESMERVKSFKLRAKETDMVVNYLLENNNRFYFGYKYDARGRMYAQGYHISPQGNAYRKAMISFADKHVLTAEGIEYLKYDIANCMGFDKETWFKRLIIATKAINDIFKEKETTASKILSYAKDADEPELFIKAMHAYYQGVILGQPIGHDMYLDATSSGIQILSALSGCTEGAKHSNINPKVTRAYTDEAQAKLDALEKELAQL